jgi:peroxiredoxin Q/BCP
MIRFFETSMVFLALASLPTISLSAQAKELKVGDTAPSFSLTMHDGQNFSLESRKGKGWTILFFYPKAGTPGCTKQACAFRDAADKLRKQGAEIYGISTDTVDKQAAFHKEQKLSFPLLADPTAKVTESFGLKIPAIKMAKRWTFILDPELKIRNIDTKVDPLLDAKNVGETLQKLAAQTAPAAK